MKKKGAGNKRKEEKRRNVALAIFWLQNAYCIDKAAGHVLKTTVYNDYRAMCSANSLEPTTSSVFGKIVHTAFPKIKTARLLKGNGGVSKYHYKHLRKRSPADGPFILPPNIGSLDMSWPKHQNKRVAPSEPAVEARGDSYPYESSSPSSRSGSSSSEDVTYDEVDLTNVIATAIPFTSSQKHLTSSLGLAAALAQQPLPPSSLLLPPPYNSADRGMCSCQQPSAPAPPLSGPPRADWDDEWWRHHYHNHAHNPYQPPPPPVHPHYTNRHYMPPPTTLVPRSSSPHHPSTPPHAPWDSYGSLPPLSPTPSHRPTTPASSTSAGPPPPSSYPPFTPYATYGGVHNRPPLIATRDSYSPPQSPHHSASTTQTPSAPSSLAAPPASSSTRLPPARLFPLPPPFAEIYWQRHDRYVDALKACCTRLRTEEEANRQIQTTVRGFWEDIHSALYPKTGETSGRDEAVWGFLASDDFRLESEESDAQVYHELADILMLNYTELSNERLAEFMVQLAYTYPTWLWDATKQWLPSSLFSSKMNQASAFSNVLNRRAAFIRKINEAS